MFGYQFNLIICIVFTVIIALAFVVLRIDLYKPTQTRQRSKRVSDDDFMAENVSDSDSFVARGEYSSRVYAYGDLFNIPSFRIVEYNKTTPYTESYILEQYVGKSKTLTLFDAYFHKYSDFDYSKLLNSEHRFPNVTHLRRAVKFYGDTVINHEDHGIRHIVHHLQAVAKNSTLLIHFRGGDKYLDDLEIFQMTIAKVLTENPFKSVVVMSGVHTQTFYQSINDSVAITQRGVDWIVGNITARGVNCTIHHGSNPDDDVYLMSQSSNFLAHRGGFSAIGALVCRGNVFFANTIAIEYGGQPEFMSWVEHPHFATIRRTLREVEFKRKIQ